MRNANSTRWKILVIGLMILSGSWSPALPADPSPTIPAEPIPLSAEATEFIRATILLLAPKTSVDEDDWGRTRRVQSGLNVRMDGLQLRTSRRWKQVRHGTWKRAEVILENPQEHFELSVEILPQDDDNSLHRIHARTRVRLRGRQQRWTNGVKIYSVSGEGVADVVLHADVQFRQQVVTSEGDSQLRILPEIKAASMQLNSFQLRRVGHAKGALVREFGRSFESIAKRLVSRRNDKLASKINEKIQKKPDRFEIPLGIFAVLAGTPDQLQ